MTRSRRVLALGATAVVLVAAGCSGDQSEVIAAGDTAEAEVIAALDAATSGTGRIEITMDVDEEAMTAVFERMERHWAEQNPEGVEDEVWTDDSVEDEASSMDFVLSGVYSGSDYLLSLDDESAPTALRVGDRTFASARESLDRYGLFRDRPGDSAHLDGPDRPTLPEGIEWIERDGPDLPIVGFSGGEETGPHLISSDQLEGISEAGASEVDGVPTRRYTASFTKAALAQLATLDFGELDEEDVEGALDEEHTAWLTKSRAMGEALRDYVIEHAAMDVEIHLDADGRLVRVRFTSGMEIEPEYADCFALRTAATPLTMTADYSELGSEVDIAEPAAATVMSDSDFVQLISDALDSWSPSGVGIPPMPHLPSDHSFGPDDEPVKLQTADGERYRADIEDDLVKFGSVIDLDPTSVGDLDDAALVEAHDRASAAIAALPTTTTALGELSRVELLWNVRWGMQTLGIDPAMADAMDDQQLAALIDAHVAEQGVVGDGIWGDGPMSYAEMFSEDFLGGEVVELSEEELAELEAEFGDAESWFDDMYAGCPGA